MGAPINTNPRLLAAGAGYLYFASQDTGAGRWHVNAMPMPGP